MMALDPSILQPAVVELLALNGGGDRLLPLVCGKPSNAEAAARLARASADELFPGARSPVGALAGLWLYFSCYEQCHSVAQDLNTPEGSYWHAILHRQEPDDGNAGYWFRQVGGHAIFPRLAEEAATLGYSARSEEWDPFAFIEYCAKARSQPASDTERLAREVQRLEWQLLMDWCARVRR